MMEAAGDRTRWDWRLDGVGHAYNPKMFKLDKDQFIEAFAKVMLELRMRVKLW
jgi:hypothetical protein